MSAAQLALPGIPAAPRGTWTYSFGMPDRSGPAYFTHLIISAFDPPERMAHGSKKRDATHWRKIEKSIEGWASRIYDHLGDGEPRSFNRICVELTGTTANVWLDDPPDAALWLLVEREQIAWACEEDAVFFLRADFIRRERAA